MLLRQDRAQTAVAVALDVAFHAGRGPGRALAPAAEVAERLATARRGLEPVLQALSRAGILESVRGPRGGYRLARRPREVRLAEVIEAVGEPPTAAEGAEPALGGALQGAVVAPLWAELDAALRERLGALTLEDLLRLAGAAGLRRPAAEPLNFAI